jgi:phytoene dehydrogenase-like protein
MTDAIVVGAGVNGLTAAGYLAKAGKKVLVVEKREVAGGLASTYELAPGFRASMGPDDVGLLLPQVIAELELERHGLELFDLDPVAYNATREGEGLLLWRDPQRSAEEIRRHSTKDAEAYRRFAELVDRLTGFLRPLLAKPAPAPEIETSADLVDLLRLGWGFRQLGTATMHELLRVLPMALSDFLGEWFEGDLLKATLAAPALEGNMFGPRAQGTSATFLYRRLGQPKLARGGAGAVTDALRAAFEARGGTLRTGAGVAEIVVENGRVTGVVLESGEDIRASTVLSAVAPRNTFKELLDPAELPPSFVSEIDNIRYRGVTAKVDLALSELPDFRGRPGKVPATHHRGVIYVGDSLDGLERASDAPKYGEMSERPVLRITIPSLVDPSLAEGGKHVLSAIVQYVPKGAASPEEVGRRALEILAEVAPNVPDAVIAQHVRTADDYERELGLPEGSWYQGEMALDQMFFMRPVPGWSRYETPIEGLYLCGPCTHPGGGPTGACGRNAAQAL